MGLYKVGVIIALTLIVLSYIKDGFKTRVPPAEVYGYHHPAFKRVAEKFRDNIKSGKERGAAIAVYIKDELVVNMWGGFADMEALRPWSENTITVANSVSKGIVGIIVATFVEKGLLKYECPVTDYWPEFGQNGKENITVEMLLSHQAGLTVIDPGVSLIDVRDNPLKVEKILAQQSPMWTPGTVQAYHTLTYGLFLDALIRKVDPQHRDTPTIFYEDIAKPFGLDMYMNTPTTEYYRTARVYEDSIDTMLLEALFLEDYRDLCMNLKYYPDSIVVRSLKSVLEYTKGVSVHNNPELRNIPNSCCYGTGTARGFAKLYSILSNGGNYKGRQLLSETAINRLSTPVVSGYDVTLTSNITYGLGSRIKRNSKGNHVMWGYTGHGGQAVWADTTNHISIAYLTNYFSLYGNGDDPRYLSLEEAVYDSLQEYAGENLK
ncbi:hypothetical protein ACF0H5_021838 [Mactra antiquata]